LVEADILKNMGCVEKKNTLSVVTSNIRIRNANKKKFLLVQTLEGCGLLVDVM